CAAERIGIDAAGGALRVAATVAELERDRVVGVARQDVDGGGEAGVAEGDLDEVSAGHAEGLGAAGAQHGGVAPADLRERMRELLEPAVVGEAAVVDARGGLEMELDPRRWLVEGRQGGLGGLPARRFVEPGRG